MKNYLNFENDIKNIEAELENLKDPYNESGLSKVDTNKISKAKKIISKKLMNLRNIINYIMKIVPQKFLIKSLMN